MQKELPINPDRLSKFIYVSVLLDMTTKHYKNMKYIYYLLDIYTYLYIQLALETRAIFLSRSMLIIYICKIKVCSFDSHCIF